MGYMAMEILTKHKGKRESWGPKGWVLKGEGGEDPPFVGDSIAPELGHDFISHFLCYLRKN